MFKEAYNVLESLKVNNWFCGEITALHAFSNECTISREDINKVRRALKKKGFGCSVSCGVIYTITKL